ncbi:hypothetical protein BG004_000164 [Podila humilis]|nr:hypothetical protein BG004_000164 [Podila humilis]
MYTVSVSDLSPFQIFIALTYIVTIVSIIVIWYIQFRDGRRHYALSFFFFWHFSGAITGLVNLFLVSAQWPDIQYFDKLFNSSSLSSPAAITSPNSTLAPSYIFLEPSSGYTAFQYSNTIFKNQVDVSNVRVCVLLAHFTGIQCLGSCAALTWWSWYIYRSLRHKRGVVNPRLMNVLQGNRSRGNETTQNTFDPEFAPGFSFSRPFRLPAFIVAPVAMTLLLIRETVKQLFFCCLPKRQTSLYRQGTDLDDTELFEHWPKYPTQMEDSSQLHTSLSSQRDSEPASARLSDSRASIPPATLASKLGVQNVDLNNPGTQEATYGYDISGMRIRYTQDSWLHRCKQRLRNHRRLLDDIVVCIVWPLVVMMITFFIKLPDRSYEVYESRGGCSIPKGGGRADFILALVIDVASTMLSIAGCLLAVLSCRLFQVQNGDVAVKIKGITPSPAVIQLLKTTTLVRNFLYLGLILNGVVVLTRFTHLIATAAHFQYTSPIGTPRPFLSVARRDFAIYTIFVSTALAMIALSAQAWKGFTRFAKACCRLMTKAEPEPESPDDASNFQFPFYDVYRENTIKLQTEAEKRRRKGFWGKKIAAMRLARTTNADDELDHQERGIVDITQDNDLPKLCLESPIQLSNDPAATSYVYQRCTRTTYATKLHASPKQLPDLNGQSASSLHSVSNKTLPKIPSDASSIEGSVFLQMDHLSLSPPAAHIRQETTVEMSAEENKVLRSLSPRPRRTNQGNKSRRSRLSIDTSFTGVERPPSTVSMRSEKHGTSRHIMPKCRCHHRHQHRHGRRYRIRSPMNEVPTSSHLTYECPSIRECSVPSARHVRAISVQGADTSSVTDGTSDSDIGDEVSAEEFGVSARELRGLLYNDHGQPIPLHDSYRYSIVPHSRLHHHRHHYHHHGHPRYFKHKNARTSLSTSNMSSQTLWNGEDVHVLPRSRLRYDDRYGSYMSSLSPRLKPSINYHDCRGHEKCTARMGKTTHCLAKSGHPIAFKAEIPDAPDSPLLPPCIGHLGCRLSSESSLNSMHSSFHTCGANEDSDIEYSATISQRRHRSDPVLSREAIVKPTSRGKMIYSFDLGRMIALPRGDRPPIRSPSSASIASRSTMGTPIHGRGSTTPYSREITGSNNTSGASLVVSNLSRQSQEHVTIRKVSLRMLNKAYQIPKEEVARTVQSISPAPQIQPPTPPVASVKSTRAFTVSCGQYKNKDKENKEKVKILFFGSDTFSATHLEALIQEKNRKGSKIERIDVVSPRERTKKSRRDASDSPLTLLAKAHNLQTFPSPDRQGGLKAWSFPEDPNVLAWDLGVVVSFGWFLPQDMIARFQLGGINVHPSLLPKYRGSAPIQRAILNDDKITGVTVQLLDPNEFDAGKILAQEEVPMPENPMYFPMEELLSKKGAELLVDVVNNFKERKQNAITQDPEKVTKANKISREACKIRWGVWSAERAERLYRANGFRYPMTASWTVADSDKALSVSLYDIFLVSKTEDANLAGTSKQHHGGYAVEDGAAPSDKKSAPGVKAIQVEGKKRVAAKDFFNGYHVQSGISKFD